MYYRIFYLIYFKIILLNCIYNVHAELFYFILSMFTGLNQILNIVKKKYVVQLLSRVIDNLVLIGKLFYNIYKL